MSIAALPPQAVRAIGSTQVLTDPASLVKELVDNALDAQATSITVEISTNALDIIQVKDNGHGIAPIDRPLVCKRHCTSKIKSLDDLAKIGGASLGFRGEALASAVEMSGGVLITTRILGEATAVSLKVSQEGEVENEDRVSQAIGTTVRVLDFLKSLPVRRQTALKESTKPSAKIKRTLQAYALARPSVRFGLKILKAKNDKGNWTYVPKAEASVSDAAVKIVGKKASDECQWITWSSDNTQKRVASTAAEDIARSTDSDSLYKCEALMPRPNSDTSAISNIGHYISVDSRPVSCTRGTLKQIIQLFKSYLRSSISNTANQKVTDPFLCMNLVCPPGSYDANVEPAKDDVLFTDSSHVLGLVESFFEGIYGELKSNDKVMTKGKRAIAEPRGFDLLLARKPQPAGVQSPGLTAQPKSFPTLASEQQLDEANVGIEESAKSNGNGEVHLGESDADRGSPRTLRNAEETLETTRVSPERSSNGTQPTWRRSMYPEEDDEQFANVEPATQSQPSEDDEDIRDVNVTNPWTLAKLSAPIHSRKPTEQRNGNQQLLTPAKTHDDLFEDLSSPLRFPRSTVNQSRPTPAKSQSGTTNDASAPDTFPYPMKAWGKAQREAHSSPHRASSEGQQSSSAVLENWVRRPAVQPTEELFLHEDDSNASRPRSDFVSASDLPLGTPLSAIPDISQKPRQKPGPRKQQRQSDIHKPFTPPVHDPQRVWFDHLKPSCTGPPKISQPRRRQDSLAANAPMNPTPELENDPISSSPPAIPTQHPGLALTMDYERRKADAVAARRALLRQQQPQAQSHVIPESSPAIKISPSQQSQQSSSSSPHQNRYRSALAALYAPQSPATDTTDVAAGNASLIDPKDPRAYLIRSNNPGKENRVRKTSLLPLETVSRTGQGRVVRELVQTIDIDLNALRSRIMMNTGCEYASETDDSTAFERVEDGEAEMWEERLKELVRGKYGEEEEGYGCLEIDVKGALEEDAAVAVALSV